MSRLPPLPLSRDELAQVAAITAKRAKSADYTAAKPATPQAKPSGPTAKQMAAMPVDDLAKVAAGNPDSTIREKAAVIRDIRNAAKADRAGPSKAEPSKSERERMLSLTAWGRKKLASEKAGV